jgi:NDP-sugar pyrophosphorylase family protein
MEGSKLAGISGVILSAGKGSRIDPFNAHFPKPLLPIGNKPIMEHHLDLFKSIGIRRVHVVVGHLMDRIINQFGRGSELGMDIQYVEQQQILGIAHAVGRIESRVEGPFLLCLGDIFFLTKNFEKLVQRYERGDVAAVLAVKEEESVESVKRNFTVETDKKGYVTRVVEKPRAPRTLIKGCGIYLFGPEIFDAIRRTPRTALRDEYEITSSIQLLIEDGYRVATEPVIDWDLNVTFPSDLVDGNIAWLKRQGMNNLVDPTARIDSSVTLDKCIIGANVQISGPRRLSQSVVLPKTHLLPGEDLHRCLVSGDLIARC